MGIIRTEADEGKANLRMHRICEASDMMYNAILAMFEDMEMGGIGGDICTDELDKAVKAYKEAKSGKV